MTSNKNRRFQGPHRDVVSGWPLTSKRSIQAILAGVILMWVMACTTTPHSVSVGDDAIPSLPAPIDTEQLVQGLSVLYLYGLNMRHIDHLPDPNRGKKGKRGRPIHYLNHKFGYNDVFDSGTNRKIALYLEGFIHLSRPGAYRFRANSNDGIRIFINGHRIIDDPDVHSDRLSDTGVFKAGKGGWFPVFIQYFQRKGSATLQLFWQPPGLDTIVIVPPEVYAHLPNSP